MLLCDDAVPAALAAERRRSRLPSLSAAGLRGGRLAWAHAVGSSDGDGEAATPDTTYRIGSITKPMVAVLVMRLVDEGLVGLTDDITAHLPDVPALAGVRVLDLLGHSSGLHAEPLGPWWERSPGRTWEELLGSLRPAGVPGHRFHYSNLGFAVLGRLVERHRSLGWYGVLRAEVLEPLGMRSTGYDPGAGAARGLAVHPHADLVLREAVQDLGAMAAAGQLWSTAADLARFGAFLARGDTRVVSERSRALMSTPRMVVDAPWAGQVQSYGLGLEIRWGPDGRLIGHSGSVPGFVGALRVDPATGDGVALLTNSTAGLSATIAPQLLGASAPTPPPESTPVEVSPQAEVPAGCEDGPPPTCADITGVWYWGPVGHVLSEGDGLLRLDRLGVPGRASRFRPDGADRWLGLDDYWAGEVLEVRRRGTPGAHLDLASFRFTRTPYDPAGDIPGGVDPAGWQPVRWG